MSTQFPLLKNNIQLHEQAITINLQINSRYVICLELSFNTLIVTGLVLSVELDWIELN